MSTNGEGGVLPNVNKGRDAFKRCHFLDVHYGQPLIGHTSRHRTSTCM